MHRPSYSPRSYRIAIDVRLPAASAEIRTLREGVLNAALFATAQVITPLEKGKLTEVLQDLNRVIEPFHPRLQMPDRDQLLDGLSAFLLHAIQQRQSSGRPWTGARATAQEGLRLTEEQWEEIVQASEARRVEETRGGDQRPDAGEE